MIDLQYYNTLNENCETLLTPHKSKEKVNVSEALDKMFFTNYLYDAVCMVERDEMKCIEEYYIEKSILDSLKGLFNRYKIPEAYYNVLLHYYVSTFILVYEHKPTMSGTKEKINSDTEYKKLYSMFKDISSGELELTDFSFSVKPTSKPKVLRTEKFKLSFSNELLNDMISNLIQDEESKFFNQYKRESIDLNKGYQNTLTRTTIDYSKKMYQYLSPLLDSNLAKDNIYLIIGSIMALSGLIKPKRDENSLDEKNLTDIIKKQVNRK